jgi:hypothetical protein
MSENEIAILFLVVSAIGGAWGARSGGQPAWKGMVVILASTIATAGVMVGAGSESPAVGIPTSIVLAVIAGGLLGMSAIQIGKVIMATVVLMIPVGLIAAAIA